MDERPPRGTPPEPRPLHPSNHTGTAPSPDSLTWSPPSVRPGSLPAGGRAGRDGRGFRRPYRRVPAPSELFADTGRLSRRVTSRNPRFRLPVAALLALGAV